MNKLFNRIRKAFNRAFQPPKLCIIFRAGNSYLVFSSFGEYLNSWSDAKEAIAWANKEGYFVEEFVP